MIKEILGCLLVLFVLLFVWFTFSYCESTAFNQVTGANTTVFQAMFTQLRIVQSIERDNSND